jgi:hypothetical protein
MSIEGTVYDVCTCPKIFMVIGYVICKIFAFDCSCRSAPEPARIDPVTVAPDRRIACVESQRICSNSGAGAACSTALILWQCSGVEIAAARAVAVANVQ